ncbi:Protein fam72a [Linnemannia zychae]|nr:Protein fam72a [Linnemannia zychae]
MPTPHTIDQSRPRRSIFQSPQHSTSQFSARIDGSVPFSDGSHSLRRSLNVAQNLSRLAEIQSMIPQSTLTTPNNTGHSSWSQQSRLGHDHAMVSQTTSLTGSLSHGSPSFSSSQNLQLSQGIHPNVIVRSATPIYTNNYGSRMAAIRDNVVEQMRSHIQSQQQQQPQQWHQDENNRAVPRDSSESQGLETESDEEEEQDEDMEPDDNEDDHSDGQDYENAQRDDLDYSHRQRYYSQSQSSHSSNGTPHSTRTLNYTFPQGSHLSLPMSRRHPQQLPSSRRIVLPPQEMPSVSWSRSTSASSGSSSQSSVSQNPQQQQLQYSVRHPQEISRRRDSYHQPVTLEQQQSFHSRQMGHSHIGSSRHGLTDSTMTVETPQHHHQRPAFLSQPVYQLACAACIRPLCLRAMKAVMLSDHSKELYSTDMPPAGLQLVNDDRQVRHCACRIRDSACLGCGQVAGYHVTQPCSDCLKDQNNGHFWMFYSSAVVHYKRLRLDGRAGDVMLWANVPSVNYDQALATQLRREIPILSVRTSTLASSSRDSQGNISSNSNERPLTACVEMEEWLNSPIAEVICR